MIDFTPPQKHHHRHPRPLAPTPSALLEATGAENSFEMTPLRRKNNRGTEGGEGADDALAVVPRPSFLSLPAARATAAPIEQRRLEAQKHRHATVWTKDPHGGRHRPAGPPTNGVDPLTHDPSTGDPLPPPEVGFEGPSLPGPTTNFVGDAMLGVPMELISSRLAAADARAAAGHPPGSLPSSSPSGRRLPLASPPKKVKTTPARSGDEKGGEGERGEASPTPSSPAVPLALPLSDPRPKIERYGIHRAREVAAELLGRRLPEKRR